MAFTEYYASPGTILTYAEMMTALDDLATANPTWSLETFGTSEESRAIKGFIIHPTGYSRTMYINCGIHGSEKWPCRAALDFLNYLAANTSEHTDIRFIIVPILNVDGYYANTRKNANGVDLNRNFTIGWGETEEDARHGLPSSTPADDNYMGTAALSEAESQAAANLIDTYLTDGDVIVCGHTTLNKVLMQTGFDYTNTIRTLNAYLRTNEHSPLPCDRCVPLGMLRDYYSDQNLYAYLIEIDSGGVINEQVNRFIGSIKSLADNDYAADAENDVSGDTSCVAHYPFEGYSAANNWGEDTKSTNDLTVDYSSLSDIAVQGASSVKCNDGSSHRMIRTDANLSADFPGKYGTTNRDVVLCFPFRLESIPASGQYDYLVSKWATTPDQRSFALAYYNEGGTRKLQLMIGSGGSFTRAIIYTGNLSLETWYKIGVSFTNSSRLVYAKLVLDSDKSVIAEITDTESITHDMFCGTARFAINCNHTGDTTAANFADAYYDDFYVFNTPKTEADFDALFNRTYGASGTNYDASLSLAAEVSQSEIGLVSMFSSLTLAADGGVSPAAGMQYLASLALESQAGTSQSNTASKEEALTLGTQAGFSPSVVGNLLASLTLPGSAGLTPAGNLAMALSNALAASVVIDAEGYVGTHVYDETMTLATQAAIDQAAGQFLESALGLGVSADVSESSDRIIAAQLALQIGADVDALSQLAAQALLTMGVDARHAPSVAASFAASLAMGIEAVLNASSNEMPIVPASNIYRILRELRTYRVPAEDRTYRVKQ